MNIYSHAMHLVRVLLNSLMLSNAAFQTTIIQSQVFACIFRIVDFNGTR